MIAEKCPLEDEELQALAGVWSASLDLDDGARKFSCLLGSRGKLVPADLATSENFPFARWEASAVSGSSSVSVKLRLGKWLLSGKGQRPSGLRCDEVSGTVLEGEDDPVYVGEFSMRLTMPETAETELQALEHAYTAKLESRPAPPPEYHSAGFVGLWRLMIAFETVAKWRGGGEGGGEVEKPGFFTLELREQGLRWGSFRSLDAEVEGEEVGQEAGAKPTPKPSLAGSWGVWKRGHRGTAKQVAGTHLWLRIDRDRCASTQRGIGGMGMQESFGLWGRPFPKESQTLQTQTKKGRCMQTGRPVLGSLEAELLARAQGLTSSGGGTADRVDGLIYFGTSSDREWVTAGRFSLHRLVEAEADEDGGSQP